MVIWTARFSKKAKAVLLVIALGVVAAVVILLSGGQGSEATVEIHLATNDDRVAYLQSLGWTVEPEPVETLQFLLPEELSEPYLTYNQLQEEQGFDLSQCCGKQVSRYTYTVTNYPGRTEGVQANLYVCEEAPVAGDILCAGADGFQDTLVFPEES
ncbi:DUF4830 domain-containing protein [Dysosmobacter sp.]|uniref:DUF4830 domain-containing protein n=1 Tax=Dysosmobacter sp. TaxID=2591382 RepID=UPI003A945739